MTTKIDEMKAEAEGLENPATGLHQLPPGATGLPRPNAQLVDRQRLLAAWEANVRTLRGVITQLEINARVMKLTRWATVAAVVAMAVVGWKAGNDATEVLEHTQRVRGEVAALAQHIDARLLAQEQKTDLVLNAMAQLLEAKFAEDAAKASPKDAELKREAVRTRVQALGSALAAKKEVAPAPAVAKEAETKLKALKVEAAEKGLEVQIPAP